LINSALWTLVATNFGGANGRLDMPMKRYKPEQILSKLLK
jgi:hypothetical protein